MLSERTRNYAVGLTMIAALAVFMIAVFKLGNLGMFTHGRPYIVTITAPEAGGVAAGTSVNFNDVIIGSVSSIVLSPDMSHVIMTLSIQSDMHIPVNSIASVGKPPTVGAAYVKFRLPPETPAATTYLPIDGSATVAASTDDGALIPKKTTDTLTSAANEIATVAKRLTTTADNLNDLLAKRSLMDYNTQDPKTRTANISILVQQINQAVEDIHGILGDPKNRDQIRSILENVSTAAAQIKDTLNQFNTQLASVAKNANNTLDKFGTSADTISAAATQASDTLRVTQSQIVRAAEQLSSTLASLTTTLDSINKGKGTAGLLVNDPRLYEGVVDLMTSLKQTSSDLNTLIQKWKDEGLPLHLK
jgi:phospholipid/cholesterol/gamma-HCH transport system substrate-binding protein